MQLELSRCGRKTCSYDQVKHAKALSTACMMQVELCELQHEDFFNLFVEVEDFNVKMSHMTNGFLQVASWLPLSLPLSVCLSDCLYLCL